MMYTINMPTTVYQYAANFSPLLLKHLLYPTSPLPPPPAHTSSLTYSHNHIVSPFEPNCMQRVRGSVKTDMRI